MDLPALRSEARNLMLARGSLRSATTCRMISPTAPVAPTTATLTATSVSFLLGPDARVPRECPTGDDLRLWGGRLTVHAENTRSGPLAGLKVDLRVSVLL